MWQRLRWLQETMGDSAPEDTRPLYMQWLMPLAGTGNDYLYCVAILCL